MFLGTDRPIKRLVSPSWPKRVAQLVVASCMVCRTPRNSEVLKRVTLMLWQCGRG